MVLNMYMQDRKLVRTCVRGRLRLRRRGGGQVCGGVCVVYVVVCLGRVRNEALGFVGKAQVWCWRLRCRRCLGRVTSGGGRASGLFSECSFGYARVR
jgi:hypothetical protein